MTALEMAGVSLTLMLADEELLGLIGEPPRVGRWHGTRRVALDAGTRGHTGLGPWIWCLPLSCQLPPSSPAAPDAETTAMAWPNLVAGPAVSQRPEVPAPNEGPEPQPAQQAPSAGQGGRGKELSPLPASVSLPPLSSKPGRGVTSPPCRAWHEEGAAGPGAGVQHPAGPAGQAQRAGPRGGRWGLRPHTRPGRTRWVPPVPCVRTPPAAPSEEQGLLHDVPRRGARTPRP